MDLGHELTIATDLARRAGAIALNARKHLMVSYKPLGQGPVTNVDHAVDEYLCSELKKAFPDDHLISEESYQDGDKISNERVWFIDPIDGTTALVAGTNDFVIMIGLAINGIARLGVVYQPTEDILWRGVNADTKLAERIHRSATTPLAIAPNNCAKPRTIIASISHKSLRQRAMIQALRPAQVIYRSSIGLKAVLIVDGLADFYVAWSKQIKLWDTCAPAAIIHAASGHISLIDDQPLQFSHSINHEKPIVISRFRPDETLRAQLLDIDVGVGL